MTRSKQSKVAKEVSQPSSFRLLFRKEVTSLHGVLAHLANSLEPQMIVACQEIVDVDVNLSQRFASLCIALVLSQPQLCHPMLQHCCVVKGGLSKELKTALVKLAAPLLPRSLSSSGIHRTDVELCKGVCQHLVGHSACSC
jgi:hypothetical protein